MTQDHHQGDTAPVGWAQSGGGVFLADFPEDCSLCQVIRTSQHSAVVEAGRGRTVGTAAQTGVIW